MLYERGRRLAENCDRCPTLARILRSPECMRTVSGLIYVSRIAPRNTDRGARGTDQSAGPLPYGISVPEQGCHLEVGGQLTSWQQDRCLVFDDSFEHSVWNLSDRDRTVLIVDCGTRT